LLTTVIFKNISKLFIKRFKVVKGEDSKLSGCGFKPLRCILDGVSEASYYIGKRKIKVAKWGTPKKYFKK
jgi:hypothetical protein